jgi:hypothetical protein
MAPQRVARLQKSILRWLVTDDHRTKGGTFSSHQELFQAIPGDKSNISQSLRTLEKRGWLVIGRTPGGKAEYLKHARS